MTKLHVHLAAMLAMTILAGAILWLIGYTFSNSIAHMTPDGKVPMADAGLFAALLLSFREVTSQITRLWDSAERSEMTAAISNSTPTATPNRPAQKPQP